jgi:hypothetical protein
MKIDANVDDNDEKRREEKLKKQASKYFKDSDDEGKLTFLNFLITLNLPHVLILTLHIDNKEATDQPKHLAPDPSRPALTFHSLFRTFEGSDDDK